MHKGSSKNTYMSHEPQIIHKIGLLFRWVLFEVLQFLRENPIMHLEFFLVMIWLSLDFIL